MNIGLTGGIACGKSTVAGMLTELGAILVDADQIAREVVQPGSPTLAQVAQRFGQAVLRTDGNLDRKQLGSLVFADPAARKDLEAILHPPIRSIMRERMSRAQREHPERLVVVDVPLLYESKLESMFAEVMVVYVPRHIQIERLMKRDGLDEEAAVRRLEAQMPIEQKKRLADYVIDNSGSLEETKCQVHEFWNGKEAQ